MHASGEGPANTPPAAAETFRWQLLDVDNTAQGPGSGSGGQGSGFRASGSGFGVWSLGFMVDGKQLTVAGMRFGCVRVLRL